MNDTFECMTVEIHMGKRKNVIISCVNRTPGSNSSIFKEWFEDFWGSFGDFNIDLLNPNNHRPTKEFIDMMYSLSLYPKITRPSQITSLIVTLIDNIFTNLIENKLISGLLVNDISNHLTVFIVYDSCYKKDEQDFGQQMMRMKTEQTINAFKEELIKQNWESVCNEVNVGRAFDRNCPMRKITKSKKYFDTPWITKELQNACKKKTCFTKSS